MKNLGTRSALTLLSALSLGTGTIWAQAAASEKPAPADVETEDEAVVLSPFVVTAEEDTGYLANATAVGGRVRTDLKDIASAISVVTAQFLTDTKAKDNQTLLQYTTNTEVGGVYGNYAGVGNTFVRGSGETDVNMLRPNGNTRVRGLDSADNTRNLVKTDIPWNGFNVGRVDFQRGPNSILFGHGSPAGIINATTNEAGFKTGGSVETQIGSFQSFRSTLDYTHVLIEDTLSVRLDAAYDNQKYRQKPAFNKNQSIYGAMRWDPKLFGKDSKARTSIKASYEHGKVTANRPHSLPPTDRITPFFDPNALNQRLIDVGVDYQTGLYPWKSGTAAGAPFAQQANSWLSSGVGGQNPMLFHNNSTTPYRATAVSANSQFSPFGSIGGFIFSVPAGVAGYGEYVSNIIKYGQQNGVPLSEINKYGKAGGDFDRGFWKDKSLTDPSIFDFYNNLIHGPTKKEWQGWQAYNITLEQTLLDNRLAFQAVYDRQSYNDGGQSILGWNPSLTIDNNLYTSDWQSGYTPLAQLNPDAGRAYVTGQGGGTGRWTERENVIVTATGELRAADFLDRKSLLARILGHHTITLAYHEETVKQEDRSWALYAATGHWSDLIGTGYGLSYDGKPGTKTGGLKNGDTIVSSTIYLSPSLLGKNGTNLNISPIRNDVAPPSSLEVRYFDSHWLWPLDPANPLYVDPQAPWQNVGYMDGMGNTKTDKQKDNPFNYVGWVSETLPIMSADRGDIDQLYRRGSKLRNKTVSKGATWQAYFFDETVVATAGYRKDRLKTRAGQAEQDSTGVAMIHSYGLEPQNASGINDDSSISWGVVARLPKFLRGKLPLGADIALGYSNGKNSRVENRYGFSANRLPNSTGRTEDISLAVTMLENRLSFKVTHYDTTNKDANISSVGGQNATLGSGSQWIYRTEAIGTLAALINKAGLEGHPSANNWEWYWNWANMTGGYANYAGFDRNDPAFLNNPETIKEKAAVDSWLAQLQPQSWYDAYGIEINAAKAQAGDYMHAVRNGLWTPANYVNIPDNGGTINGQYPTGTIDIQSKGWEFEIAGQPIKNLDISLNASKQFASQNKLGTDLVNFVEAAYAKYTSPAGDLRLWWGGDGTLRNHFLGQVWSGYQFQAQTNGKMVNEMSPWRANLSGTYRFDHGMLKGAFVGGSYRWQQGTILGYRLNDELDNLDINRPIWSKSRDWVDIWFGYGFNVTEKLRWTTQVNLRNVGRKVGLVPISVQPDGSPAGFRIEEGMTWMLSNTLSF
ncbi:MAG TPA: TonB-dependent receptor plug domain-containing protein [Opitutaceae bacterium]|nr:TonB-dependent receptor plug domain-containing protein [Opitutaceae bacterium]HLP96808.1 TonB-dependent receptor plug domain-containing protein [Sideroxyarcus sp.]